jgi:IS1 family transposase
MNTLSMEQKVKIVSALVEGNSIRSIERMTGVHRDTVMRLGLRVGEGCARFLDAKMRNVCSHRVQVDEIWTFVGVKQARLNGNHNHSDMGDQYVFVSLDADSKLVISHMVGKRDAEMTWYFIRDLKERLANRVQLTSDGFRAYIPAVEDAFGANVDFAQLVKVYGQERKRHDNREWYSPVRVMAAIPTPINGRPDTRWVSTSFVERQNLTMRMQIRRLTRLTNAFSKKLRNLKAAVALYFAHYNFVRIHGTLRCTPAIASGITDHLWNLEELMGQAMSN